MPNRHRLRMLAMLAAASFSFGAAARTPSHLPAAQQAPWLAQITIAPSGSHIIGNPDAKVKLVEYMSYTCPHCAAFEAESATPLRADFVAAAEKAIHAAWGKQVAVIPNQASGGSDSM